MKTFVSRSLPECLGYLQATIISVAGRFKTDWHYQANQLNGHTQVSLSIFGKLGIDIQLDLSANYENEILSLCAEINAYKLTSHEQ